MATDNCLNCKKKLTGRAIKFCNADCRKEYWAMEVAKGKALMGKISVPHGTLHDKDSDIKDITQPIYLFVPTGIDPETGKPFVEISYTGENETLLQKEIRKHPLTPEEAELNGVKEPTTIEELIEMCPPELTGIERTRWITKERMRLKI